jgi:hypothetical protein
VNYLDGIALHYSHHYQTAIKQNIERSGDTTSLSSMFTKRNRQGRTDSMAAETEKHVNYLNNIFILHQTA